MLHKKRDIVYQPLPEYSSTPFLHLTFHVFYCCPILDVVIHPAGWKKTKNSWEKQILTLLEGVWGCIWRHEENGLLHASVSPFFFQES